MLRQLREANVRRCEASFHPLQSWSPADWALAVTGELGEACNMLKKQKRAMDAMAAGQPIDERDNVSMQAIGHELADAVMYIDLLAARLGIDLEQAIIEKFNLVSERVGSNVYLPRNNVHKHCGVAPPDNPESGDRWVDAADPKRRVYVWDGDQWLPYTGQH